MFRSITPLMRSDAARIEEHLIRLCTDDRSLRFGLATALMQALTVCIADRVDDKGATVVGSCAARNLPMRAVFGHAGMTLRREDDEFHAHGVVRPSLAMAA